MQNRNALMQSGFVRQVMRIDIYECNASEVINMRGLHEIKKLYKLNKERKTIGDQRGSLFTANKNQ